MHRIFVVVGGLVMLTIVGGWHGRTAIAYAQPSKAASADVAPHLPTAASIGADEPPLAQGGVQPRSLPPFQAPELPQHTRRYSRSDVAHMVLEHHPEIAQARAAVAKAQAERLRARARHDAIFRTGVDAMHAETPVDSGITSGINRQDLVQLKTGLSRRFDSGTTLSVEMQNGYVYSVFPLMIAGVLSRNIESGPNYLNQLTFTFHQNLLKGRGRDVGKTGDVLATLQVRLARERLRAVRQRVVQDAMQQYATLYMAEAQFAVQKRSYARTQRQIEAARAQLDAGHLAPYVYNRVLQRLAQNADAWLVAEQALRSSARALALNVGLPHADATMLTEDGRTLEGQREDRPLRLSRGDDLQEDMEIVTDLLVGLNHEELIEVNAENATQNEEADPRIAWGNAWCARAMQHNADIQAASAQLDAAYASIVPIDDAQRDQLDLQVGVTSTGLDANIAQSLQKMATFDALTFFGGLSYQRALKNRRAKAQREMADSDLTQARIAEESLRQSICTMVTDAAEQVLLQQKRERLAAWRTSIAYEGFEAESDRFAHGQSDVTLVLDALSSVDLAELEELRTYLDRAQAWWTLQRVAGTILLFFTRDDEGEP